MTQLLGRVIADFNTQLAAKIAVGGTTGTLASATDDDGVALPAGRYFFTIDKDNSKKEHISCTLSGTALTNIKTVSRQGTETAGVLREHRVGANVIISDFAHLKKMNDVLDGTTSFDSATPLGYDGAPTISTGNQFATKTYVDTGNALDVQKAGTQTITGVKTFTSTAKAKYDTHPTFSADEEIIDKKYADDLAIAGSPDASTTVKGIVEIPTLAEVKAETDTGGTGAILSVTPSQLPIVNEVDIVAGENLTAGDAVMVAAGIEATLLSASSSTNSVAEAGYNTTWCYQSFVTGSTTTRIYSASIYTQTTVSSVTMRLRATPTGADIATTTQAVSDNAENTFVFSTNTVTPSTTYYLVFNVSSSLNPGSANNFLGGTTSSYGSGVSGYSTNSGSSWTTPASVVTGDFYFKVFEGYTEAGKAYKTSAGSATYVGTGWTTNFIGFVKSTVSAAATATVRVSAMYKALSGLTPGTIYYLSNTPGAIATTAGTTSKKVGLAVSSTSLLIKHDN